jgi:hypothetical protein
MTSAASMTFLNSFQNAFFDPSDRNKINSGGSSSRRKNNSSTSSEKTIEPLMSLMVFSPLSCFRLSNALSLLVMTKHTITYFA